MRAPVAAWILLASLVGCGDGEKTPSTPSDSGTPTVEPDDADDDRDEDDDTAERSIDTAESILDTAVPGDEDDTAESILDTAEPGDEDDTAESILDTAEPGDEDDTTESTIDTDDPTDTAEESDTAESILDTGGPTEDSGAALTTDTSSPMEICADGIDNDGDGLTDTTPMAPGLYALTLTHDYDCLIRWMGFGGCDGPPRTSEGSCTTITSFVVEAGTTPTFTADLHCPFGIEADVITIDGSIDAMGAISLEYTDPRIGFFYTSGPLDDRISCTAGMCNGELYTDEGERGRTCSATYDTLGSGCGASCTRDVRYAIEPIEFPESSSDIGADCIRASDGLVGVRACDGSCDTPSVWLGNGRCDEAYSCGALDYDAGDCRAGDSCTAEDGFIGIVGCDEERCVTDHTAGVCDAALDCLATDYDDGACTRECDTAWVEGDAMDPSWPADIGEPCGAYEGGYSDFWGGRAVTDCLGGCSPAHWLGNGECNDGPYSTWSDIEVRFNCAYFGYDEGDCCI